MTRTFAGHLAWIFFRHAASERYPTRTVEHMLAWMILVWSYSVAMPGQMLTGPTFAYLLAIAPEEAWGACGMFIGAARLVALYLNGNWRRSPGLRLIGAMFGMIWWVVVSALWWLAIMQGAQDFPMRKVAFVFIFFEAYSCFRCGQDHASPSIARAAGIASKGDAGNG
jgi:hypothetical protein